MVRIFNLKSLLWNDHECCLFVNIYMFQPVCTFATLLIVSSRFAQVFTMSHKKLFCLPAACVCFTICLSACNTHVLKNYWCRRYRGSQYVNLGRSLSLDFV